MKFADIEISNPIHKHALKAEQTETPFRCDGCKEAGIGHKYRCDFCDFDLHANCAAPPSSISIPFYPSCTFRFHTVPPGFILRLCDACRAPIAGFVFHCSRCGFDLHPCCAALPATLDDGDIRFQLYPKAPGTCHRCGRRGLGWAYRSDCESYCIHVACVKELLVESWEGVYSVASDGDDKTKVREIQRDVPSLKGTLRSHHRTARRGVLGKVRKCCQIAGQGVRVVVSAMLGDPTAIIAAVVWAFITKK